jgi:hypothetical protein
MGTGAAGRSRVDLLPGEVIELEVVSPTGPGVTYLWELTDKAGSSAALTSTTAASTQIGSSGAQITELNGFKIRLTANDNGTLSSTERIACVRSTVTGLRPALFAETAPASARLAANDPDLSTDNSQYGDLAGTGVAGQNWRGYAQWQWELLQVVEGLVGGNTSETEIDFGTAPVGSASFVVAAVGCTPTSKVMVWPSSKTATGRVGNDAEWDQLILSAVPGTDQFTINALAVPGPVSGRRVVMFQIEE